MYTSKPFSLLVSMIALISLSRSFAQTSMETDSAVKRKQSLVITLGGGVFKVCIRNFRTGQFTG
jgi:hypothetical protein